MLAHPLRVSGLQSPCYHVQYNTGPSSNTGEVGLSLELYHYQYNTGPSSNTEEVGLNTELYPSMYIHLSWYLSYE